MKVLQGQSIIDIAIQQLGSADGAFELAKLNGLSITDDPFGLDLVLPDIVNKPIADYYKNKGISPATEFDETVTEVTRVFFEELSIEFS